MDGEKYPVMRESDELLFPISIISIWHGGKFFIPLGILFFFVIFLLRLYSITLSENSYKKAKLQKETSIKFS